MDEIGDYPIHKIIGKDRADAFSRYAPEFPILKKFLDQYGVTDLVVVGCNGGACVKHSMWGANSRGYRVWIDPEGVIDFNYWKFIHPYRFNKTQLGRDAFQARHFSETDNFIRHSRSANTVAATPSWSKTLKEKCAVLLSPFGFGR